MKTCWKEFFLGEKYRKVSKESVERHSWILFNYECPETFHFHPFCVFKKSVNNKSNNFNYEVVRLVGRARKSFLHPYKINLELLFVEQSLFHSKNCFLLFRDILFPLTFAGLKSCFQVFASFAFINLRFFENREAGGSISGGTHSGSSCFICRFMEKSEAMTSSTILATSWEAAQVVEQSRF